MAFDDLRSFLQALDDQGQLLKISEEVNAEPDLAAAANATGRIGDGAPALWFDNIRGFNDARVTMNTIGSWQNHAISLGLPPNTPVKKQIDAERRRGENRQVAGGTGESVCHDPSSELGDPAGGLGGRGRQYGGLRLLAAGVGHLRRRAARRWRRGG